MDLSHTSMELLADSFFEQDWKDVQDKKQEIFNSAIMPLQKRHKDTKIFKTAFSDIFLCGLCAFVMNKHILRRLFLAF